MGEGSINYEEKKNENDFLNGITFILSTAQKEKGLNVLCEKRKKFSSRNK